jgi:hypothetical protein
MSYVRFIAVICFVLLLGIVHLPAQKLLDEAHMKVAMRMLGDQLLLRAQDSSTRVMPVLAEANRYKLSFEQPFSFDPEVLIELADEVVHEMQLGEAYRIEVVSCASDTVVYSFEVREEQNRALIPCRGRVLPTACYVLYFTPLSPPGLMSPNASSEGVVVGEAKERTSAFDWRSVVLGVCAVVLFGLWLTYKRQKTGDSKEGKGFQLGSYFFNSITMELSRQGVIEVLSSKEADLLVLLHSSRNQTLERGDILKSVWGDEGGYVGRTLDVFISKLRKKLEADPDIKIVNVRGVGYKLIA